MLKKSKLVELFRAAIEESDKFGVNNQNYFAAKELKDNLEKQIQNYATPFVQDMFLSYIEVRETLNKYQIIDGINKGYRNGLLAADMKLKSDTSAYISTNVLMHILETFRSYDNVSIEDIIAAIENLSNPTNDKVEN